MSESGGEVLRQYLRRMAEVRATGAATNETSYYGPLENLLNALGQQLRPRVVANGQIRNQGAGHPDFGLYGEAQCRHGDPIGGSGAVPERGVVEVKGLAEETWLTADTPQVTQYWQHYGLVLVTNYRAFLLIGRDEGGAPRRLESFILAESDQAFWSLYNGDDEQLSQLGDALIEYLRRALSHAAPLTRPADLAWLLASYARDALRRVEASSDLPALQSVRTGLEQALGLQFTDERGEHFFRSTLVQTLFYGIFSAWVQWARAQPAQSSASFDWHAAGWTLHVPMVRTLFEQVATPTRLGPLGLVEVLDWTGQALNRVDRSAFFSDFEESHAVQYFYEPFLAQFDPSLRKQLGVWYTPPEVVRYMVERVDRALRDELNIAAGLADPNVYVLDPCCGTGSFLVEALRLIKARLQEQGEDALVGQDLKSAAQARLFGFELMPAPFVISHWQLGTVLANAGVPLEGDERAAVYLTNALTGWEHPDSPAEPLLLPELQPERDAAERVKRDEPIIVIIGNPPYNAFAGVSPAEEEGLVEAYKQGLRSDWQIRKFNLDELYTRFLRVAERRIVQRSGRGIVCFVSSYSYLSDASFVVVRRHLLEGFDSIWIDSLNGDSRETGKRTPSGDPDPSIFSTPLNREGIRLGTAIGMFVKRTACAEFAEVHYRDFWGSQKREQLLESLDCTGLRTGFQLSSPNPANRFNFRPTSENAAYQAWPDLIALAEDEPFSGMAEMRRGALMALDRSDLSARMQRYFQTDLTFATLSTEGIGPVEDAAGFPAETARAKLLARESFQDARIIRYALFPLDTRFAYWTAVSSIWNRARPELFAAASTNTRFLVSRMMAERPSEGLPVLAVSALPDYHLLRPNIRAFPLSIAGSAGPQGDLLGGSLPRANLSGGARHWLSALTTSDPDLDKTLGEAPWYHAVAICASRAWLSENRAAILAGWPRVPLPASMPALTVSADLGRRVADLLDTEAHVNGVTIGTPDAPFQTLGRLSRFGGGSLGHAELGVTAGWGRGGGGAPVMPGQGHLTHRETYDETEMESIEHAAAIDGRTVAQIVSALGPPVDVWLNEVAYLRAVPRSVWTYTIGGYQVLKKWLSYREQEVLGRSLTAAEAREAVALIRRLTAIVLLQEVLDRNYEASRDNAFPFGPSEPD